MAILHRETIELDTADGRLTALVIRPAGDAPLPGIVQIQEWWGIEPHAIDVAQRLAGAGFVVLLPDLYQGRVVTEPDEAAKAVMMLRGNMDSAVRAIQRGIDALKARPDVQPKQVGIMGFCVGGLLTWEVTLRSPDIAAAVPWYAGGFDPTPQQLADLHTPVFAIYGGSDPSIPMTTIHKVEELLKDKPDSAVRVYPAAGHAFLNPAHGALHAASAADAWPRAVEFLQTHVR
ncbi:MAG: dienelactone hydrolase family protein [Chloroflexota bacterium]|nr:dienelactone hydrolase family protein [Chloroflexota bacterium]